MNAAVIVTTDRRTALFYATLLLLVALDLVLLFWLFNPFTRFGTADQKHPAAQQVTHVDQAKKPSPFELTSHKAAALNRVSANRAPKRTATPAFVALRQPVESR